MTKDDDLLVGEIIEQAVRYAQETEPPDTVARVARREVFELLRRNRLVIAKQDAALPRASED